MAQSWLVFIGVNPPGRLLRFWFGVGQHDAEEGFLDLAGDEVVRLRGVLDIIPMGDDRGNIQVSLAEHGEDGFNVAAFCPAHIGEGVILAFFFIGGVIAARAIGTGDVKTEFLGVINFTGNIHTDSANGHNLTVLAGEFACQGDRVIGFCVGANEDNIKAFALGEG